MEDSKIFRFITRANSVLIFLLITGGMVLMLGSFVMSSFVRHQDADAVKVAEVPGDETSPKLELELSGINEVEGSDVQYILLKSKWHGGKFSSGYGGGEIRNVLFLVGKEPEPRWIFPNHANNIRSVSSLVFHDNGDVGGSGKTLAIFYEYIDKDSNGDGELDADDLLSIALSKPDGSGFTVLDTGITSQLDEKLLDEGRVVAVLSQKGGKVYFNKYKVDDFTSVGSKVLLSLN